MTYQDGQPPVDRVTATPAALDALARVREQRGAVIFYQSGGCCDGSLPICMHNGELLPSPGDELLGTVGGAPFYVDSELYARWGRPTFLLDVRAGAAEGFSLSPRDAHFVTRPAQ